MLDVQNLGVTYANGVRALHDVHGRFATGKVHGILGPSGAGKSTFLKGLLELVPRTGNVTFHGEDIRRYAKTTAYVEQKEDIDRDFPITVLQCVLTGTYPRLGFFKRPGQQEIAAAHRALEQVRMLDFQHRQIGQLSGGQLQRVLIARALVQQAELLLLDEPFVGIDVQNEAIVIDLLKQLASQGATVLIVHHDLDKVHEYFDEVTFINQTLIAAGPVDDVYNRKNLSRAFPLIGRSMEQSHVLQSV